MNKSYFLCIFFLNFFILTEIFEYNAYNSENLKFDLQGPDTFPENQNLFNGRVWRNLYRLVKEGQFLFSKEFLSGSLTINGKTFTNISIKYDIYNDEILTPIDSGRILQLNKEMVDSFSFSFQNKTYQFTRMPEDSLEGLSGYANLIYKGKTALYVKYIKKIEHPVIENEFDKFYQLIRIYLVKDNHIHLIAKKSDLFKVLKEDKAQIKAFVKKNKLWVSKEEPESFIPVIRYYESLNP
jgi:hypothetical protein